MLKIRNIFCFFIFFIAWFLFFTTFWTKYTFGYLSFGKILYHATHSLVGTPSLILMSALIKILIPCLLVSVFLYFLPDFLQKFFPKKENLFKSFYRFKNLVCLTIAFVLLIVPYKKWNVGYWIYSNFSYTNIYEKHYVHPKNLMLKGTNRNLIVLFLESYDTIALNYPIKQKNINLLPLLTKESKKGFYFPFYEDLPGTNWTIASQVSFFCGIPLTGTFLNRKNDASHLLPNTVCWPEILQKQGYNTVYMQGSSIIFSDLYSFFQKHGFEKIIGKEVLLEKYGLKTNTPWGVSDKKLLQEAKKQLTKLGN